MKKKHKYDNGTYFTWNEKLLGFMLNTFMLFIYFVYYGIPIGILVLIVYGIFN